MGKTKGWVERAHKTGNWASHETKARQELTKSGAWIRALPKTGQPDRYESEREDLRSRTTPEAAPAEDDLRPEEYVESGHVESGLEEHDEEELPDGEGSVVAEPDDASVVTLSLAYDAYQAHGGNRQIPDRVLAELGEVPIEEFDRATIIAVARRLYPRSSQGERAELFVDPMEEILGLARSRAAPKPATKQRRFGPLPEYWIHRRVELEAAHEKFEAEFRAMATAAAAQEPDPGEWYSFWNTYEPRERDDWASVKPVGPPPDKTLDKAGAAIKEGRANAHAQAVTAIQEMAQRERAAQQHAAQQQHAAWIREQDAEFERRVPEMRDADKAERLQKEARRYLTETLNLKPDEINALWNNSALGSAAGQQMLLDASRWRAAEREARNALAKQPRKPQQPGTATARPNGGSGELFRLADAGNMESYVKARNSGRGTR